MITLSNINDHTLQEIFDQVVDHLLTQKRKSRDKSVDSYNGCVYRDPCGSKCAVGCLISDEEYSPIFEGKSLRMLNKFRFWRDIKLDDDVVGLLDNLQCLHDDINPSKWGRELKRLAFDRGLQFNYKEK